MPDAEGPEIDERGQKFSESMTVAASHSKKLALQSKVAYIQKDKQNSFHNYRYASAEAVLKQINPAMLEARMSSTPIFNIESEKWIERGPGKAPEHIVTVSCALRLTDEETGYSEIGAHAFGSGMDTGDKACMKAQTAALKYAWTTALNIATGDDPEADAETDKRAAETTAPTATPATKTYTPTRQAPPAGTASPAIASVPPPAAPAVSPAPTAQTEGELLSFPPVPLPQEAHTQAGHTLSRTEGKITDYKISTGKYKKGPVAGQESWTRYDVTLDDGKKYSTFNRDVGDTASMLAAGNGRVVVFWQLDQSGKYRNMEAIDDAQLATWRP